MTVRCGKKVHKYLGMTLDTTPSQDKITMLDYVDVMRSWKHSMLPPTPKELEQE
jgi:hypothetical protein